MCVCICVCVCVTGVISRLGLDTRVALVDAEMVGLDTQNRMIELSDGSHLPYDLLVITCGLQEQTCNDMVRDTCTHTHTHTHTHTTCTMPAWAQSKWLSAADCAMTVVYARVACMV